MSTISEQKVRVIIRELQDYFDVKTIPELADRLGYSPKAIYQWIHRRSVPGKKLKKMFNDMDIKFLETGEGSLLEDPTSDGDTSVDVAISRVHEISKSFQVHSQSDTLIDHAQTASLELVKSSIKLLQAYVQVVEEAQRNSRKEK